MERIRTRMMVTAVLCWCAGCDGGGTVLDGSGEPDGPDGMDEPVDVVVDPRPDATVDTPSESIPDAVPDPTVEPLPDPPEDLDTDSLPYLRADYTVEYLGASRTRRWLGTLSPYLLVGDFLGDCSSTLSSGVNVITISVEDPDTWPAPKWKVAFHDLRWPEGAVGSLSCDHVEIFDESVGSSFIPCAGGTEGTCQVTADRNESLPHTVRVWFTCNEFDTNVSSGGVPNRMSISPGALMVQNCSGF